MICCRLCNLEQRSAAKCHFSPGAERLSGHRVCKPSPRQGTASVAQPVVLSMSKSSFLEKSRKLGFFVFARLVACAGEEAKSILKASKGGERHGSTVCGVGCAGGQGDEADPSGPLVPLA